MDRLDESDAHDYKAVVEMLKKQGNDAFKCGDSDNIKKAIKFYTEALELDPDNHLIYSNRSAAHMKNDSKSEALRDAEKCVQLCPEFSKGYNRLGVAQQSLKRFTAAIDTFKKGIAIDPSNQALFSALCACQAAHEADKKQKRLEDELERKREEEMQVWREKNLRKVVLEENNETKGSAAATAVEEGSLESFFADINASTSSSSTSAAASDVVAASGITPAATTTAAAQLSEEDEAMAAFFSSVSGSVSELVNENALAVVPCNNGTRSGSEQVRDERTLTQSVVDFDLQDTDFQLNRLLAPSYAFKNLNPYYVLQLESDATEEDIKYRYRKLSTKVHPDKLASRGEEVVERARLAFEEVKTAYEKLTDEREKKTVLMHIEHVRKETQRERRRLLAKGLSILQLPDEADELRTQTMKYFADIEMKRRLSEKNLRAHSAREKSQEREEKRQLASKHEFDREWRDADRTDKRVSNWRGFQEEPGSKKLKSAHYVQQTRGEGEKYVKPFTSSTSIGGFDRFDKNSMDA